MAQERLWIIDPIDGTRAFIEGRKEWCVAQPSPSTGRPVLAAVYRPTARRILSRRLPARAPASMASRWPSPIPTSLEGARIAGNRKALSGLAHLGIAADPSGALPLQLRLAYVAAGRLDGAVSIGKRNDWDLAAGELLVLEAGGAVSGTSGEGYIYNRPEPWQQGLVAAGAKRHAALSSALRTAMTKAPAKPDSQLLHLVFGGELDDVKSVTFKDLHKLDVVGFYPNYAEAHRPGSARRARRWTMPRCAISSSTCTACSTPRPEGGLRPAHACPAGIAPLRRHSVRLEPPRHIEPMTTPTISAPSLRWWLRWACSSPPTAA